MIVTRSIDAMIHSAGFPKETSDFFQDDDQDALIKGLNTLKEVLNEPRDLSQLEPAVFLTPFLEIIRSEETTGPVTSLALSAVNKIISYGLVG